MQKAKIPKKKLNARASKYSKKSLAYEVDENNDAQDEMSEEEFPEDENSEEQGFDEQENYSENEFPKNAHKRSHGLFKNVWWKKGLLKGFVVWLAIVIIFYIFDFLGMVEVIDWKRWFFFLVLLAVLGLAYEKFSFKRMLP